MLIAGAGGHAKEILGIFDELHQIDNLCFFDDVAANAATEIFGLFPILKQKTEVVAHFKTDNKFVLGVGSPKIREQLAKKLISYGGKLVSIVSPKANIGSYSNTLGNGINVMTQATITQNVSIGEGALIHINAIVHHDVEVGHYCEISPNVTILGKVKIGNYCTIGAGAIILPGIVLGDNVTVGAGAVVTRDVASNQLIKGVPAK